MKNKIVIITGANSGIGKAATIKFCDAGYTVVMACRNLKKSKFVQEEIIKITKNTNLDLLELDISSIESIKDFIKNFKNRYNHLDILVHNAGHFNHGEKNYQLSKDNLELTFATNTFGPFLLTHFLLDWLKKSDDARVLHACSTNIRHFFDPKRKIDFDDLQGKLVSAKKYNSYKMYGDSKMALLMMTFKMADYYKNDFIKVNAVQIPAIKISKATIKNLKPIWRLLARIQSFFGAAPEKMADTYFYLCTSEAFRNISGKLINDKRIVMESSFYSSSLIQSIKQLFDKNVYPKYASDKENIERIWQLALELTLCK
jgi:NAD(P)-dependent dehydrogenase (short-subunit alcohol dehydrogenase family)